MGIPIKQIGHKVVIVEAGLWYPSGVPYTILSTVGVCKFPS